MAAIDRVIGAAIDGVKKSGVIEASALMATVSVVNADGTLTVTRGADTYPKVRCLSGYLGATVGDLVEILKTSGGWVAIGRLRTSNAPRVQRGTATTPATTGTPASWGTVTITFPKPFANVPIVVATAAEAIASGNTDVAIAVSNTTTTSFILRSRRNTAGATDSFAALTCNWIATDY